MRGVRPIAIKARIAAIRAFNAGAPVGPAIEAALAPLRDHLRSGMVASHLQGRLRAAMAFKAATAGRRALSDPFRESLKFLERRLDLTPDQIVDLADTYTGDADTIVRALGGDLNDKVGEAVAEVARSGLHTRGGIERLREAFDAAGMGPRADWQLETLYRTQVQTAYSAGQWNANQSPEIQEVLWGYTYVTVGDDRVRPTHATMDGMTAPKEDPVWRTAFPPCGYNCRCTAVEVFHGDPEAVSVPLAAQVEVDGVLVIPGPDEGWDFNAGDLYRDTLGLVGVN